MASYQTIGVIGAGAWGTALAQSAAQAGRSVKIWAYEAEVVEAINTAHENTVFLPGAQLNPAITASSDPADLSDCDAFLMVAPAQHARGILTRFAPHIAQGAPVLLCAKGFERESLALMTDVLRETVPHAIPAVLSGPSFAIDVAKGLPTAVTLACEDRDTGEALMEAVGSQTFRPYWSGDLVGAEVGGSVKNVLGLCGLGDLVLTCSSPQSRNMSCGLALGQGQTLESVLGARKAVTEGVATAPAVVALAKTQGVDMPICAAVDAVLAGRISVDDAIQALLNRPFGPETD